MMTNKYRIIDDEIEEERLDDEIMGVYNMGINDAMASGIGYSSYSDLDLVESPRRLSKNEAIEIARYAFEISDEYHAFDPNKGEAA